MDIILASASPRRCEILKNAGYDFTVITSDADESSIDGSNIPVSVYVQELALLKAADVVKKIDKKADTLVIGADTVVYSNDLILGKPKDETDAYNMLTGMSGKEHQVYTGFAVVRASDMMTICGYEKTDVKFADLTDREIKAYVNTGECMDKAGAYAIQGRGAVLVEKINGDYLNVVGLPVQKLSKTLKEQFGFSIL